jgi:hypothetical protein
LFKVLPASLVLQRGKKKSKEESGKAGTPSSLTSWTQRISTVSVFQTAPESDEVVLAIALTYDKPPKHDSESA